MVRWKLRGIFWKKISMPIIPNSDHKAQWLERWKRLKNDRAADGFGSVAGRPGKGWRWRCCDRATGTRGNAPIHQWAIDSRSPAGGRRQALRGHALPCPCLAREALLGRAFLEPFVEYGPFDNRDEDIIRPEGLDQPGDTIGIRFQVAKLQGFAESRGHVGGHRRSEGIL